MTGVKAMSENAWFTIVGRSFTIIGVPVIIVLLGWQLNKQDNVQQAVSNLGTRMSVLEAKVDIASSDPYHGADAKRDFQYRDDVSKQMENHIENLDSRVQALEVQNARRR